MEKNAGPYTLPFHKVGQTNDNFEASKIKRITSM